jgi:hypothetical protein
LLPPLPFPSMHHPRRWLTSSVHSCLTSASPSGNLAAAGCVIQSLKEGDGVHNECHIHCGPHPQSDPPGTPGSRTCDPPDLLCEDDDGISLHEYFEADDGGMMSACARVKSCPAESERRFQD